MESPGLLDSGLCPQVVDQAGEMKQANPCETKLRGWSLYLCYAT